MLLYNEADRRNTGLMIFLFSYSVWSIYRIGERMGWTSLNA